MDPKSQREVLDYEHQSKIYVAFITRGLFVTRHTGTQFLRWIILNKDMNLKNEQTIYDKAQKCHSSGYESATGQ